MASDYEIAAGGLPMLGLHRLVAAGGDRLVPELHDAMTREAAWRRDHPNVVRFPLWAARHARTGLVDEGSECGKLLAFAPPVKDKEERRKRRTE